MHLCERELVDCPFRKHPLSKWGDQEPPACHGRPLAAGAPPGNSPAARKLADRASAAGLAVANPAGTGVLAPASPAVPRNKGAAEAAAPLSTVAAEIVGKARAQTSPQLGSR